MPSDLSIGPIGQVAIRATDVPRACAFYRDVLGFQHLFDAGPTLSFLACGGVRLMLSTAESGQFDHPASVLYYKVPDIQHAFRTLEERGAEFIDTPHLIARLPDHELWMVFLRDTEGNVLALMSEVRAA
ncbi:MAG: VOC family protein [Gemmatimonadaceae bacterium]|nr:VOC family protein [Gemmatimonadaceae bacterium]